MAEPRDDSVVVSELSRFRSDHADYVGMTDSEKRRAITRLLRQCNFLIPSLLTTQVGIDAIRATVPVPAVAGPTKQQMHAGGIVWVRCNANSGNLPRDGQPVIFDIITGNEVTGLPLYDTSNLTAGSFYPDMKWNSDEYTIVGFALRNSNNDSGFYQLPILLTKTYDFIPEGRMIATPMPSGTPLQSPSENVSAAYDIEPMNSVSSSPSWKEMRIQHFSLNNTAGNIGEDMTDIYHIVADRGIVMNPYPFGFIHSAPSPFGSDNRIYVQRSGGVFVIDRPMHSFSMPMAVMSWSTSAEVGSFHEVTSLTMPLNPIFRDQGSGQLEFLPVAPWRYRVHGYVDVSWTGGTQDSVGVSRPVSVLVGPFGTPMHGGYTLEAGGDNVTVTPSGSGTSRTIIDYTVAHTAYATVGPLQISNYPGSALTGVTTAGQIVIEPIW